MGAPNTAPQPKPGIIAFDYLSVAVDALRLKGVGSRDILENLLTLAAAVAYERGGAGAIEWAVDELRLQGKRIAEIYVSLDRKPGETQ